MPQHTFQPAGNVLSFPGAHDQADIISITSRREMLRFGAAAAIAGLLTPGIAAPAGDTALLALCRQLDEDSRAIEANETVDLTGWTRADQDRADVVMQRAHDTIEAIAALPALTFSGIRAKARALGHALKQGVLVDLTLGFEDQAEDYELLAWSLTRDLEVVTPDTQSRMEARL